MKNDASEEKALLLQVARGNEFAFRQLFYQHQQRLCAYIYKITGSTEVAEEILQDVFLKIWTSRESLATVRNFSAYLFIVSRNQALNALRKQAKNHLEKMQWEKDFLASINQTPDEQDERYSLLDSAISKLPPQQQKVFILSRYHRYKHAEIADRVQLSPQTVKKYLQIAVHSIEKQLQNEVALIVFSMLVLDFFYRDSPFLL